MVDLKSNINYLFEVDEISEFLESKNDVELYSPIFFCNGAPFCVWIKISEIRDNDKETKVLDFGFTCNYESKTDWTIEGIAKMTLYTFNESCENKTSDLLSSSFCLTKDSNSKCYSEFITLDRLSRLKNGYVRKDKIIFGIDLKAEKVEKDKKSMFKWMKL